MPPLHEGHSHQVISANIKELRRSGQPLKNAIAISLNKARTSKAKQMAEGGEVEPEHANPEQELAEEGSEAADAGESRGPLYSEARDVIDSGEQQEEPVLIANLDKGSPPARPIEDPNMMTPQLIEILKKKRAKFE